MQLWKFFLCRLNISPLLLSRMYYKSIFFLYILEEDAFANIEVFNNNKKKLGSSY